VTSAASGADLALVSTGARLPFVPSPPIQYRSGGRQLWAAAIEGLVRDSRLVSLDRDGRIASPAVALPFLVTGLDVGPSGLLLAGNGSDGGLMAVGLDGADPRPDAGWTVDVPPTGPVTQVAVPTVLAGRGHLVWQTAGVDAGSVLWMAEVGAGGRVEPTALGFDDLSADAGLAVVGDRLALARVHGQRQALDVVWMGAGGVHLGTVPVAEHVGPATPAVGALDGAAVVAWNDGRDLRLTCIPTDAPSAPAAGGTGRARAELSVGLGSGRLRSCAVLTGEGDRAAIVWHSSRPGDPGPTAEVPGRREPVPVVDGWVAGLDVGAWRLGAPVHLDPPGTVHHGGGWVGDRLLVVHGAQEPVVSVLEPVS